MGLQRKKEIYDICVEYGMSSERVIHGTAISPKSYADVVIVEDDPYYFLQMGTYVAKSERAAQAMPLHTDPEKWIASLAPSYLKYVSCADPPLIKC